VRILPSALAHAITETQIRAALQVPMRRVDLEEDLLLVIGADQRAQLLELIVADLNGDDPRIIHTMPLRAKFYRYL
jgi:hypothetical protein